MLEARLGNTIYALDESSPNLAVVTIVCLNQDGETRFHVARELFEAYAVRRTKDAIGEIMRAALAKTSDG
jgi:hypothetical protein